MNKQEIEKAIKNLEYIKSAETPYGRLWKICELAISALEKQIPKTLTGLSATYEGRVGNCPCCKEFVREMDTKPSICKCGQKLDWRIKDDRSGKIIKQNR